MKTATSYTAPYISSRKNLNGGWVELSLRHEGKTFLAQAQVYEEGSFWGINEGRVSKLCIWEPIAQARPGKRYIYSYDRRYLDITSELGEAMAKLIVAQFA